MYCVSPSGDVRHVCQSQALQVAAANLGFSGVMGCSLGVPGAAEP